MNICLSD